MYCFFSYLDGYHFIINSCPRAKADCFESKVKGSVWSSVSGYTLRISNLHFFSHMDSLTVCTVCGP